MQVTVSADKLKRIIGAVAPYISTDATTPILRCVRLTVYGRWLVTYATDRYTLGVCRTELAPDDIPSEPFDVVLGPDTVKLITTQAWNRDSRVPVEITVNERAVTIKDYESTIVHALPHGNFPDVEKLLRPRADSPDVVRRDIAYNPDLLARYAKTRKILGAKTDAFWMNIEGTTRDPVTVSIGNDFIGVIMPLALRDEPAAALDGAAWFAEMRTETARADQ
jgi:hypothetical protein